MILVLNGKLKGLSKLIPVNFASMVKNWEICHRINQLSCTLIEYT
jgi:hypothetical protein